MFRGPVELEPMGMNYFVSTPDADLTDRSSEDVSDRFAKLADFSALRSRLSWADSLRNVRIAEILTRLEPNLVIDVGCGTAHPVGRAIVGQGLDTFYVGIDASRERAMAVAQETGNSRVFYGMHHDMREGLPFDGDVADVVTCLEAMEHFTSDIGQVKAFLLQVRAVLVHMGLFVLATPNRGTKDSPLQHPNCHDYEVTDGEMFEALEDAGFEVAERFNYRARPAAVRRLLHQRVSDKHGQRLLDTRMWMDLPEAMIDAMLLPELTLDAPVPGNVIYFCLKS